MSRIAPLLALLAAAAACQSPDVGAPCTITWGDQGLYPAPTSLSVSADYIEFNAASGCENLVCIVSPAAPGTRYASTEPGLGYCSKACVSNRDCYQSETELECRMIVLDPAYIAGLDPLTRERYLGDVQYSSYCGAR